VVLILIKRKKEKAVVLIRVRRRKARVTVVLIRVKRKKDIKRAKVLVYE